MVFIKKICFVSLVNIEWTPYLDKYTKIIRNEYDIIYWSRLNIIEKSGAKNEYIFKYYLNEQDNKVNKLLGYLKFRKFVKKILKRNKYDVLIIFTSNLGVLLGNILNKKYKKHYIIDIRDYFLEKNKLYYSLEKSIIRNASLAVISSPAYKKFLPKHEYTVVHNSQSISSEKINSFRKINNSIKTSITISCIGGIRFIEQFKRIIGIFKNDNRFNLQFIGYGADLLDDYCNNNNISNVYLKDRFPTIQTESFYMKTDIILNAYGNNNPLLDYALSNKLYYSTQFGKPILVSPNTYMSEIIERYKIGFILDLDNPNIKDELFNYYSKINWTLFYNNCDTFLLDISRDNKEFEKNVKLVLDFDKTGEI